MAIDLSQLNDASLIFCLFGLLVASLGGVLYIWLLKRCRTWVLVKGKVVSMECRERFDRDRKKRARTYYPVYQYEWNGNVYRKTRTIGSDKHLFLDVGDELEVLVNPSNPEDSQVKGAAELMIPLIVVTLGAVFLAIGLFGKPNLVTTSGPARQISPSRLSEVVPRGSCPDLSSLISREGLESGLSASNWSVSPPDSIGGALRFMGGNRYQATIGNGTWTKESSLTISMSNSRDAFRFVLRFSKDGRSFSGSRNDGVLISGIRVCEESGRKR